VRGGVLDVCEDEHGGEVGDCGDGEDGGLEVGLEPGVAGDAGGEVGCGGEEHVPVGCLAVSPCPRGWVGEASGSAFTRPRAWRCREAQRCYIPSMRRTVRRPAARTRLSLGGWSARRPMP